MDLGKKSFNADFFNSFFMRIKKGGLLFYREMFFTAPLDFGQEACINPSDKPTLLGFRGCLTSQNLNRDDAKNAKELKKMTIKIPLFLYFAPFAPLR
ncbi:MAG: hypothetical protein OEV78_00255 [Spirochaetia bacterium]|nr:hypothetical protein [Spirochaetia bacterium]